MRLYDKNDDPRTKCNGGGDKRDLNMLQKSMKKLFGP